MMRKGFVAQLALALLLGLAAPSQGAAASAQSSGALRAEKSPATPPQCCVCGTPCNTNNCNWQVPTSTCACDPGNFNMYDC
jgi:hypothetical protein